MSTAYTKGDALGIYHTGAHFAGGTQQDADACLGGIRSSTEITRAAFLVDGVNSIGPIAIENMSGVNGLGTGIVGASDSSTLQYVEPGASNSGTSATVSNGSTVLLEGTDVDKWVRVSRDSADSLGGKIQYEIVRALNNAIGQDNISNAERAAGHTSYRGLMLRNHSDQSLSNIKVWIDSGSSGIEVGWETVDSNGDIQTIANDTTAPTSITWNTGTTSGTGLTLASLATDTNQGLWIKRVVSAGASGSALTEIKIHFQWDYDSVTYNDEISGWYRMAETALAGYELTITDDIPSAPVTDIGSALPRSIVVTPPGSGQTEFYAIVKQTNEYGLTSLNNYTRTVVVASGGSEVSTTHAPQNVTVEDYAGGNIRIYAEYSPDQDATPADTFQIYVSGDGTAPDPTTDTPTEVTMTTSARSYNLTGNRTLNHTIGPYANGSTVQVLVRTKRASDSATSTNSTATSHTVGTLVPLVGQRASAVFGSSFAPMLTPASVTATVNIDAPNNTRFEITDGVQELYVNNTLAWRLKYDSANPENNGFWTTYGILQEVISGAGTGAYEATDANTVYINVGGVRRMKIDNSASTISFAAIQQGIAFPVSGRSTSTQTVVDLTYHSIFQVWDRKTWDYVSVASLDTAGTFSTLLDWEQRDTTGEFN